MHGKLSLVLRSFSINSILDLECQGWFMWTERIKIQCSSCKLNRGGIKNRVREKGRADRNRTV